MKSNCLKCNKYTETNDSGYCERCYNKVFKQQKYTTKEQRERNATLKIIVTIIFCGIIVSSFILFGENIGKGIANIGKRKPSYKTIANEQTKTTNSSSNSNSIEDTILTYENYDDLTSKYIEENKNNNNSYYLYYSTLYYMTKDGLSSAFDDSNDEQAMYKSIYGKTIKQLVKEGKQIMDDKHVSIDDVKESINSLGNMNF